MLRVHDWDQWQSYRTDRGPPPWIKVHRSIMRNLKWVSLTDTERGQLVGVWLLAGDQSGHIPDDARMVQRLCLMTSPPNLERFVELGFLERVDAALTSSGCHDDANVTSTRRQHDALEVEVETEAETEAEGAAAQPRRRRGRVGLLSLLPESHQSHPDLAAAVAEWQSYRSESRKPLGERSAKEQANLLARYPPEVAAEMIRTSIRCQWQGLFAPKDNPSLARSSRGSTSDSIWGRPKKLN